MARKKKTPTHRALVNISGVAIAGETCDLSGWDKDKIEKFEALKFIESIKAEEGTK